MLKGKSAIVTGGSRGIGKEIAETFCKNGADVLICYNSNDAAAAEVKEQLAKYGTKVEAVKADVSSFEDAAAAVQKAKELFGKVDILVNNAGITNDKLLMRMTEKDFTDVIDVNLTGCFNFVRNVTPVMVKQKSGRIINISSIVGLRGNPAQVNYSASKAGIIGLTLSVAKELGRRGITANAIAPGYISTDMTGILSDELKEKVVENISLGRMGETEDIANVALFLASDLASYVTGQIISVDGGMSI